MLHGSMSSHPMVSMTSIGFPMWFTEGMQVDEEMQGIPRECAQVMFLTYVLSLFFHDLLRTKPIALTVGPYNSGKIRGPSLESCRPSSARRWPTTSRPTHRAQVRRSTWLGRISTTS